jgi:hypothetical protein
MYPLERRCCEIGSRNLGSIPLRHRNSISGPRGLNFQGLNDERRVCTFHQHDIDPNDVRKSRKLFKTKHLSTAKLNSPFDPSCRKPAYLMPMKGPGPSYPTTGISSRG